MTTGSAKNDTGSFLNGLPGVSTLDHTPNTPVVAPTNDTANSNSNAKCILIADDDPVVRSALSKHLRNAGYGVIEATDGVEALRLINDDVLVALFDLQMPGANGFQCLEHVRRDYPETQVIVVTGSDDVNDAVTAMKQGACEYITKPFDPEQLLVQVQQAVKHAELVRDNRGLRELVEPALSQVNRKLDSEAARELEKQIDRLAALESTVLLTGESGTGKTTIARQIHERGARAKQPFVAVNCASLPRDLIEAELFGHCRGAFTGAVSDRPGRVEVADGGTLFLDEIGDLPLDLQPKLLTFLQDRTVQRIGSNTTRTVDVRLIVATHQDLAKMCEENRFREDLFYRLNVLPVTVPPIRQRQEDIPALIDHILARLASRQGGQKPRITHDAVFALRQHAWPGNIRELENVLERAAAFCHDNTITQEDIKLPKSVHASGEVQVKALAGRTLADVERQAIIETLEYCRGNKARTARTLGISEKSIYNKMKRLEITYR